MAEPCLPDRRGTPLRLLQFTDMHLCADATARVRGVATRATFERCLAHARANHQPADALLLTGDLVQDDARAYRVVSELLALEPAAVHCLPGNHDLPQDMPTLLDLRPFDHSPVLRYGDWTLVQLDSCVRGRHQGQIDPECLVFLDDTLRRFADTHALVILHHQPVPVGSAWLDAIGLANGPSLLGVIARHDNVRGLLWGHVHQAFDGMRDGIALMGTPSTCFQFVPRRDDMAVDDCPPGYRWLHLYPDGRIDSQVVWVAEA